MAQTILKVGNFPLPDELFVELRKRADFYDENTLSATERLETRANTDIVLGSGGTVFQEADFATCPRLKGIVCYSVGYDGIDVAAAVKRNIFVTYAPDTLNDEVANTAMMLLLCCTRQAKDAQEYIEQGKWLHGPAYPLTTSIDGKKMGIAGLGRIGKAIATRAKAFNMEVGYYGRQQQAEVAYPYFASLKDLAAWCDVLMLVMPASAENTHCVNAEVLAALGSQGFVINVGRGSLIDTEALITALETGQIAGAGLDVFEHEPEVPAALQHLPNVALLPHLGSATIETRARMTKLVLRNVDAQLQGKPVITPVPGTRKQ